MQGPTGQKLCPDLSGVASLSMLLITGRQGFTAGIMRSMDRVPVEEVVLALGPPHALCFGAVAV